MVKIPTIPEGHIAFGDAAWIAVRDAHGRFSELLRRRYRLAWRRNTRNDQPTEPAHCEFCDQHVIGGDKKKHYTRGWRLWAHSDCYDAAKEFVAEVDKRTPNLRPSSEHQIT